MRAVFRNEVNNLQFDEINIDEDGVILSAHLNGKEVYSDQEHQYSIIARCEVTREFVVSAFSETEAIIKAETLDVDDMRDMEMVDWKIKSCSRCD